MANPLVCVYDDGSTKTPEERPLAAHMLLSVLSVLLNVSVTCFFLAYLVALLLELSRVRWTIPGRFVAVLLMMSVGLLAHVSYLFLRVINSPTGNSSGLLSSWAEWSLLLALGLAICFLIAFIRRPDTIISFYFLPLVLFTIVVGTQLGSWEPFARDRAADVWGIIHGLMMALGTGAVLIGFLAGVMYLVQSRRLKRKQLGGTRLRLPTLETLDRTNRQALVISTFAVAIGVVAGIIMNLNQTGKLNWSDSGIIFSFVLFGWLLVASAIEFFYSPASRGRKAFYMTLASLGFLLLALFSIVFSSHGVS
ncbi:Cytochrome C assembly protein [Stieleria bergensis]|uniref:Cytochrome C assembly protein n=2 Tax=Stieleria bergensis TaxID=2528025 RepID=A0A517T339_9BACT|nr:Cytochrome C assembly protein [Planctomycetes bacterium SV_7m_r]